MDDKKTLHLEEVQRWKRDCEAELNVGHPSEIFLKFVLLANIHGYSHVAHALELPTSAVEPAITFYANYADNWRETFLSTNWKHHGARTATGKRTNDFAGGSVYWTREDFLREAQLHGIKFLWQRVLRGAAGTVATIALSGRHGEIDATFNAKTDALVTAASERLEAALIESFLPQAHLSLTKQESRYLMWVLDGKSAEEIANIMDIPTATAKNMQRKLPERFDRKGITATAFMAYQMGLLRQDPMDAWAGIDENDKSSLTLHEGRHSIRFSQRDLLAGRNENTRH